MKILPLLLVLSVSFCFGQDTIKVKKAKTEEKTIMPDFSGKWYKCGAEIISDMPYGRKLNFSRDSCNTVAEEKNIKISYVETWYFFSDSLLLITTTKGADVKKIIYSWRISRSGKGFEMINYAWVYKEFYYFIPVNSKKMILQWGGSGGFSLNFHDR